MRRAPPQAIVALIALIAGCGGWKGNIYRAEGLGDSAEATYAFGEPPPAWREVRDLGEVQVAWVRPDIAGAIELRGQCEEQGDSSLEQYTDHLRIDWTDWKVVEQRRERMLGRDALRTVVEAEIDGVLRRNELLVLKKNGCLFDLRYSASPSGFAAGRPAFEAVVAGFRYPL